MNSTPTDGLRLDLDALAELLPCPFCGGTNISLREDARANMAWCTCVSCGLDAPTETGVTKEQAVEYWNRRAALPSEETETEPVAWAGLDELAHLASNPMSTVVVWGAKRGRESSIACRPFGRGR